MKLKATISLPGEYFTLAQRLSLAELVIVTNSDLLHRRVYEDVLGKYLRVGEFGPAEYFTQLSDRMTLIEGNTIGVDVTLSGVSVTARRAQKDFWDSLEALHELYSSISKRYLVEGLRAQVFSRMALDAHIGYLDHFGSTSLLENGPSIVEGSSVPKETNMAEVVRAELECLLGDKRTLDSFMSLVETPHKSHPERGN